MSRKKAIIVLFIISLCAALISDRSPSIPNQTKDGRRIIEAGKVSQAYAENRSLATKEFCNKPVRIYGRVVEVTKYKWMIRVELENIQTCIFSYSSDFSSQIGEFVVIDCINSGCSPDHKAVFTQSKVVCQSKTLKDLFENLEKLEK